jgi:predicted AlkP superfamily pyrophosphatase or phosphodiesterase
MKTYVLFFSILCFGATVQAQVKKVKHVLLIGVDGLGAYAFPKANTPTMTMMMDNGAWSLHARSVLPSSSADNWASMLMGSGTEVHGYTQWDSKVPELPSRDTTAYGKFPTIFYLAKTQKPQLKTAVIYNWGGIGYLFEKNCVNYEDNPATDSATATEAAHYIREEKPNLLFVHFSDVDGVGHNIGHNTPEYYKQMTTMDGYVKQLLDAVHEAGIADETIVILTSDHGGINKGHGGKTLMEVEIPWIVYGKAVKQTGEINQSIITYDTGSTIAYLLGLKQPQVWTGRAVKSPFSK